MNSDVVKNVRSSTAFNVRTRNFCVGKVFSQLQIGGNSKLETYLDYAVFHHARAVGVLLVSTRPTANFLCYGNGVAVDVVDDCVSKIRKEYTCIVCRFGCSHFGSNERSALCFYRERETIRLTVLKQATETIDVKQSCCPSETCVGNLQTFVAADRTVANNIERTTVFQCKVRTWDRVGPNTCGNIVTFEGKIPYILIGNKIIFAFRLSALHQFGFCACGKHQRKTRKCQRHNEQKHNCLFHNLLLKILFLREQTTVLNKFRFRPHAQQRWHAVSEKHAFVLPTDAPVAVGLCGCGHGSCTHCEQTK